MADGLSIPDLSGQGLPPILLKQCPEQNGVENRSTVRVGQCFMTRRDIPCL